ncbi:restriction endonuclease [Streptomyces griseorubiginosus]|uniref:restriction endonuclease n=1 Tax=Streptomyces griseorubiginosus TaxID=67304 RepID=UPI002E811144|nr:restriction endonuclease [Streptomyces griseorubiginosus]WUB42680.1 restriction endonuclease [Streptomyces griseorubiginosus]WUB51199.1 restriction endonuclease [Streptomyces griseorubiginosus]
MFDEDGSLDPLLKYLLYAVITLAVGKMLWKWLTEDVGQWITVDVWGLIADHPWRTGLIVAGGIPVLLLLVRILSFLFGANAYVDADDIFVAPSGDAIEADVLTFKMKQLSSMSATGFEQACTDLLARDGFRHPRRVGGAGDLGVDITARDDEDRLLIVQCKQYQSPVGSGHIQKFNGTARPHHGADLPIMIALNGFTQPAIDFAQHHQLILMGRPELKRWAHGEHLYDVLGIQSTTQ